MKILFPILAAVLYTGALAAQSCPCAGQFDWLRQKLALNYSGYRDKVTPQNQAAFEQHSAQYQTLTAGATSDTACLRLLAEWAQWFRDGHIQLYPKGPGPKDDTAAIRARFNQWEKFTLPEAQARDYLQKPGRDPIEGIYQNAEGNYRVAIVKNIAPGRDFAGVIMSADNVWWMPEQVKFDLKQTGPGQYTSRYYMRDHSERNPAAAWREGRLEFEGLGAWYKQFPGVPLKPAPNAIFTLESLDSSTLLLTVPTMNESVRSQLDSLVQANSALLGSTPNLIIDCRNNGGGSDITFYPLRRYVYTGKVKSSGGQIYATDDNLEKYERLRHNKDFPKKYRLYFGHIARKMKRNKGEFVGKCKESTQKIKNLSPNPQRVAILINGGCASSCEQFVYYARQSKRVTLIGQNTAGILDYGNLHNLDFPCEKFGLAYPTSRSCRVDEEQAIDGTGMPPDVRLENKDGDWVRFAADYLKQPVLQSDRF